MSRGLQVLSVWNLVASAAGAALGGCDDNDRGATSAPTDATGGETETHVGGYCPSTIFDLITCGSSQTGYDCPGTEYCEGCGKDVVATCRCVPYDAGFHFECEAPCDACIGDEPDVTDTGDSASPSETTDTGAGMKGAACDSLFGPYHYCAEYAPGQVPADGEAACTSGPGGGIPGGTWVEACDLEGAIGYCQGVDARLYNYELTNDTVSACTSAGGTWHAL